MEKSLIAKLVLLFVITQAIGLIVAVDIIKQINAGTIEQPSIITENPNDIENALGLIVYIILFTAVILIIIRFVKGGLLFKAFEALAVFASSWIVFTVFIPDFAFIFAVLLVLLRSIIRENIWLRNFSSTVSVAGVGAIIGVSLGLLPILVFIILLSIYDIIAVFGTKHMVVMAKAMTKQNLSFTYALPSKKHQFELGTGDMVIPLAFSVSVLHQNFALGFPNYFVTPSLILIGSLVGLILTLEYANRNIGKALPALPPQTIIMIAMLVIGKFAGF